MPTTAPITYPLEIALAKQAMSSTTPTMSGMPIGTSWNLAVTSSKISVASSRVASSPASPVHASDTPATLRGLRIALLPSIRACALCFIEVDLEQNPSSYPLVTRQSWATAPPTSWSQYELRYQALAVGRCDRQRL